MKHRRIENLLEFALTARVGSGISASYGKIDDLRNGFSPNEIYLGRHAHAAGAALINRNSHFDLASLTKILLTTLLAMIRTERGEASLSAKLSWVLPDYVSRNPSAAEVTVGQLLSHTSGLPAWRPFHEKLRDHFGAALPLVPVARRKAHFDSLLDEVPLECAPGERVIYSDLGFLLLERILSRDLTSDAKRIFGTIPGLQFHDRPVLDSRTLSSTHVATEVCPWRGLIQGTVHDDNAWSRGGLSGHAGLFGRLCDVQLWVESLFNEKWVSLSTLRQFTRTVSDSSGAVRAFGFDVPSATGAGSTGTCFSMNSIGHLGFTGTSLWMDLDAGEYAILLTNRVHPSRFDDRIRKLRIAFHEEVRR
jgi:CubicO group peptidase (beta-lactamase class C family)